jgi:hypothetical protein
MQQSIIKSFKDLISRMVLGYVAKIALLSLVLSGVVVWLFGGMIGSVVSSYLSFIPWEWLQQSGLTILNVLISYMIFISIHAILTSVMIEPLLVKLIKKHYPAMSIVGSPDIRKSIIISIKAALIFLGVFLATLPISFVPLVGAVWMLWVWSLLIKEPTIYDIHSLISSDTHKKLLTSKQSTIIAMIASGFNYIPVLNILSTVYAYILFLHFVANKQKIEMLKNNTLLSRS